MADFEKSYRVTMVSEGFYSDVNGDPGGETWKGIARNMWPSWRGWDIIDAVKERVFKDQVEFQNALRADSVLEGLVRVFYKEQFWNRFYGDSLRSQELADELFDSSVNCGVTKAVLWLQESLNIFSRSSSLVVDGVMGRRTAAALNTFLLVSTDHVVGALIKDLNVQQGYHYHNLAKGNMYKFIEGWYNRVRVS